MNFYIFKWLVQISHVRNILDVAAFSGLERERARVTVTASLELPQHVAPALACLRALHSFSELCDVCAVSSFFSSLCACRLPMNFWVLCACNSAYMMHRTTVKTCKSCNIQIYLCMYKHCLHIRSVSHFVNLVKVNQSYCHFVVHILFEWEGERDCIDCGKFKPINLYTFTHTHTHTITKPICCVLT